MGEQSFIMEVCFEMNFESMALEEIWQQVDQRAKERPELIADMNATYSFNITGEDGGNFGLSFKDGSVSVLYEGIEDADCTIIMNTDNFKKLIQGNLNSASAFMTGRLKVKGNIGLALKLESLIKQYEF